MQNISKSSKPHGICPLIIGRIGGENTPQKQQTGASEKLSEAPLSLSGAADKI